MIHTLDIDYITPEVKVEGHTYSSYSACTFSPLFMEFPNLQTLKMASAFWHFDNDARPDDYVAPENDNEPVDRVPVNWPRDQELLNVAFKQAGLLTPPDERIWRHLTAVTLDFWEENNQGAFLMWDPSIFLVDTLRELTIRGMHFHEGDGLELVGSPHRGTTKLKKLALERSAIQHISLQRFLSMPEALTHLTLEHHEMFEHHEIGDHPFYSTYSGDWGAALERHNESLEFLHIGPGPWAREYFLENLGRYPNLKVFETFRREGENRNPMTAVSVSKHQCEVRLFE